MEERQPKTNAVRLLEGQSIEFHLYTYDASDGHIDAGAVARKIGVNPDRLFKTLITRAATGELFVFCIPGTTELDLRKAARAVSVKSIALVRAAELRELTGYERGGCSPIGLKHPLPVILEESAMMFERIVVSGGAIGLQIELSPLELRRIVEAGLADVV